MRADRVLLVVAVAANGLLAGATLDQAVKQMPARHRIGVEAFSAYSRADLSNGVAWYAILGVGTAVLTLGAVVAGLRARTLRPVRLALAAGAAGAVGGGGGHRRAHGGDRGRAALQVVVLVTVAVAALDGARTAVNGRNVAG